MNNDMNVKQDIIDELDFAPSVDAAGVGVTVNEGLVTLSGHVPHYYQKTEAEEAVWRVFGVRGIVQDIEVRPLNVSEVGDHDLAHRAVQHLQWNALVPDNSVQVKVRNGWIVLKGEVVWQFQRKAAADVIKALQGVRGMLNQIKLSPDATAVDVKSRIEQALHRHADVEAAQIQVGVDNGQVTLDGHIESWLERSAVNQAAWSAPGVVEVIDHLSL